MTFVRLLVRNLRYHWRGNCAVLLGVVLGTAVLTGALLVGDSLRGSLRELTGQQLGGIDHVLVTNRLFRHELAQELLEERAAAQVCAALVLQGSVRAGDSRAGRVNVIGVDSDFWKLWPGGQPPASADFWQKSLDEVVLNQPLANELGVTAGQPVVLNVQKVSAIPRESLLGQREASESINEITLTVRLILPDDGPASRFQLNPAPTIPRNAFVPLATLQRHLAATEAKTAPLASRRINALLVAGGGDKLQSSLARHLTLDDWGLVLRGPEERADAFFATLDRNRDSKVTFAEWPRLRDKEFAARVGVRDGALDRPTLRAHYRAAHPYLTLESQNLLIENAVAAAVTQAAHAAGLRYAPTLVYLADGIKAGKEETAYAVVAALPPHLTAPLGPFLPKGVEWLGDDEIVLVNWPDTPFPPGSVKRVTLSYYDAEVPDRLHAREFRVRGWVDVAGPADDPDLTPPFPGITDQPRMWDWVPPKGLHYTNRRIKGRDDLSWRSYRTTPKAYINLDTGQGLWSSRFGSLTSVRLAPKDDKADLKKVAEAFERKLRGRLAPEQGGFVFDAVRKRALEAGGQGTDFGMLFLAFSVFLIASALVLVGLLFRLNLERRAGEIGLLLATGIPRATVRCLLLAEGGLLAVLGGLVGSLCAVGYAWLLLEHLRFWWPGELERSFLRLHGSLGSYLLGYGASLLVSLLTILWAIRVLGRVAPRDLLAGETTTASDGARRHRSATWRIGSAAGALLGAVACLVAAPFVQDHVLQAVTFVGSGMLLLVAGLVGAWSLLQRESVTPSQRVGTLGVRNAGRHPARSLLTVSLLASATFLIVAVEAFHRDPGRDFLERTGGSGGFALLAESDLPLFLELDNQRARDELDSALDLAGVPKEKRRALGGVSTFSFRLRQGDDASCLNLAQPRRPRLLGVGSRFIHQRGGFHFQSSEAASAEEQANPWLLLEKDPGDGSIPVIGEAETVKWMLKSGLGQELTVPNENGQPVRLRVVGLLQDSIFQSELLMSDANFRRLYPREAGFKLFLIDAPQGQTAEVKRLFELGLANHGFAATTTTQRVEQYMAVVNTYLATFQALGGLGLLLGAIGLAIVLLRSVWERRGELALLRALGFRRSALGWLVLAENGFLLVLGLGCGLVAALFSVSPHLVGGAGALVGLRVLGLLALVLFVGLIAGLAAVASTLRAPLLPALRRE